MFFKLGPRALEMLQAPCYLNPALDRAQSGTTHSSSAYSASCGKTSAGTILPSFEHNCLKWSCRLYNAQRQLVGSIESPTRVMLPLIIRCLEKGRFSWNLEWWVSSVFLKLLSSIAPFLLSTRCFRPPSRGVTKGGAIPRPPKSPNNDTTTFFNTVHLLPKDLSFEHGGAKIAACPERHITSLRPCPQAW